MKLIDKEKALRAIANEIRALHNENAIVVGEKVEEIGLRMAFDIIKRLPTVGSRPKGKWIEYTDCEGKSRKITCNQCGHEVWSWFNLNYCPHCGADTGSGK